MKPHNLLAAALLAAAALAHAAPPPMPGLLPAPVARALLEQDPEVAAARSGRDGLREDARLLQQSPYEWTARVSGQRRGVDDGSRSREWNAGLERTLRLPAKADADARIGRALQQEGEARHGAALHQAARELLALWLDWTLAEQLLLAAQEQQRTAQDNLSIVEKRLKAGDAARLDASLARAELAGQQRAANDARTAAEVAWAHLHARFPGLERQHSAMPAAAPLAQQAADWRARILSQSDALKVAAAESDKAQAQRARAHAERTPDPTLGIYTGSEAGGRERITGVMVSVPLPSSQRGGRAASAAHAAEMARHQLELTRRQVEGEIAAAQAAAQGAYDSWQLALDGSRATQDNARLSQRAYALGEAGLPSLLDARRQSAAAAQQALAAQADAARAYYTLMIDAHLVWDLQHD
jgi:outer membrane protein TolC